MKVRPIDPLPLTEEEKETIDIIGMDNLDYCVAAIVQSRNPDRDITYIEDENAFEIDGERFELQFEITADDPSYYIVSRHVQTLELFFEE